MNRDILEEQMGKAGFEFISDTAAHIGKFCALRLVSDTVFAAILPAPSGNTFTGVTIPSGTTIPGTFTSVTLTSGSLMAFKEV